MWRQRKTVIVWPTTWILMWTIQFPWRQCTASFSQKLCIKDLTDLLAVQYDLQAWALGTSEMKSVCRYNSSGVQNHQHVNTDRIHESNLPPMLCTVWHKYWIIYTKSTHFHLKATVKHEACMSPEPVKAGVKYSKVWNHYVMCFWKDLIVIMITGSISNRLVKHYKCYKCMFLFAVL